MHRDMKAENVLMRKDESICLGMKEKEAGI
jgi:hypothetical protein